MVGQERLHLTYLIPDLHMQFNGWIFQKMLMEVQHTRDHIRRLVKLYLIRQLHVLQITEQLHLTFPDQLLTLTTS